MKQRYGEDNVLQSPAGMMHSIFSRLARVHDVPEERRKEREVNEEEIEREGGRRRNV